MLTNDSLSQLSQLKESIRASKDLATGSVRATSGRFGFVVLDDGREAFLNPEQMERVFHDDRVEINVITNDKGQLEAEFEKFIASSVKHLSGRYCIRGKGHFIITDLPNVNRWIFIPPRDRAGSQSGDYVTAKLTRHPYKDGKAQAKITYKVGNDDTPNIERGYTLARHQIEDTWPEAVLAHANTLNQIPLESAPDLVTQRKDLQQQPFITIDSASTRDMDDALWVEATDNGWTLHVAIADPSSEIEPHSALDKEARKRINTVYFPGNTRPMLPEALSNNRFSLVADSPRRALVCALSVAADGEVTHTEFIPALIRSHGKLSYQQASAALEGRAFEADEGLSPIEPHQSLLEALHACTTALNKYRVAHYLVAQNRPDFHLHLSEQGKLESIEKVERTLAHTIVEEAMLASNINAGHFLAHHNAGLHNCHNGFRDERRDDIEKLLQEKLGETVVATTTLEDYRQLITRLQADEQHQALISTCQRFLQPSQVNTQAGAHFGLGVEHYATITSPIRRYQDLFNHRTIYALLEQQSLPVFNEQQLVKLQETIANNRKANRYMEQWLISDYMQQHIGKTFTGIVALLTNQGVGVRLKETGIEGFVLAKKPGKKAPANSGDKISFNNQRMELSWNEQPILLDQEVEVVLVSIDREKKRLTFAWPEKAAVKDDTSAA